jgi:RNA polymerase sigma-70 factor (ECF subfamily)
METRHEIEPLNASDAKLPHAGEANSLRDLDELISSARAGDGAALNRLLAHVRPRLFAVALRIVRDRDDAEDVVQEALLKVCRYLTRFEGRSAFSTWLHRILVNTALDRLRHEQSRWERVVTDVEREDQPARTSDAAEGIDEETPELIVGRAETGAVVREALASLSPAHQEALALREFDGESYQDIARIARCPVGTIMSRLHHARRRLASELAPHFGVEAGAALQAA